jgi:hypothetical protein
VSRSTRNGIEPEFFATHWERTHLLLGGRASSHYDSLITVADLERMIAGSDLRYPAIQLAKGGGYLPPAAFTRTVKPGGEADAGRPDVRKLTDEYRRGASIALSGIHKTWAPFGAFCGRLEALLDHAVHANAYLTPGRADGFTAHYDVHEVFVLQIAGSKRWRLYPPVVELPYRTQLCTPQAYRGQAPTTELELRAGDLLYLPRGVGHSTTTSESFSAHVTIGVTVHTWVDLIRECLEAAAGQFELRRALPPGFASDGGVAPLLRSSLVDALNKLGQQVDVDALLASFKSRVRTAHPLAPEPFMADVVTAVEWGSLLAVPTADRYRLSETAQGIALDFDGRRHEFPDLVAPTLRALVAAGTFRTADLATPLQSEVKLGLSRHLHEIGFLRFAVT